ncbi:galactitol-specific phosphotransferase system IIB component [Mycoplasmoides fastidiosum]|uniref:Galactitol-specific phosphotransferase system IIB component n=1 Tax=Mycoplasmoides fastidiosum TaxID=92758 RepID=A0ABU0LZA5_9BACT|nr:hypothetical protein [Mycoplasmoides fastidiosum]MDQ0513915.1 galactitol-specific phosphotransferase system IIB component [Mycoplasmoides fastidiosum]UUD37671.1 hypothetical protein NPA10_03830 [Mycoplasmoides fastidiosum]
MNRQIRQLLEIIIHYQEIEYEKISYHINISRRTWYRRLDELNNFLKINKLEKINSGVKNFKPYQSFLISLYQQNKVELLLREIALVIIIDNYLLGTYKKTVIKKHWNLSNSDFVIVDSLVNNYYRNHSHQGDAQSKKFLWVFFTTWFCESFYNYDLTNVLVKKDLKQYFPKLLVDKIQPFINFENYHLVIKALEKNYSDIQSIKDFFLLTLVTWIWFSYIQENNFDSPISKWFIPQEYKDFIACFLTKDYLQNKNKISQAIQKVVHQIDPQITISNNFQEVLLLHLINETNVNVLDQNNFHNFNLLKQNYAKLHEIIEKAFQEWVLKDPYQSYYLLLYFINFFYEWICKQPWKINTICWGGMGISYILKTNIERIFPNAEINACSYSQLKNLLNKHPIDIIFSTIDLEEKIPQTLFIKLKINNIVNHWYLDENTKLLLFNHFLLKQDQN